MFGICVYAKRREGGMKKNAPAEKSGAKKPVGKSAEQHPIKEKLGKFFEKYDLRDEGKIRFAFK